MEGSGNPSTLERLLRPVFLARCHEARHFSFGDVDLVTTPCGERDVLDDIVAGLGFLLGRSCHDGS